MLKRICSALAVGVLLSTMIVAVGPAPARAAKTEPSVSALAWYWEDARKEEREVPNVGTVTIETPNPFCPSAPGGLGAAPGSCAEGRLPVEIQNGDYEAPNKISAVNFDMTLIPVGSTVNRFTVTFREAKEGCYDKGDPDDSPEDDVCETTSPINVGEHQLQACLITQYFGDGEARPYNETPRYECSKSDPKAKRKEVTSDKDGPGSDFYWTFDLTPFARKWVANFTSVTGILITGVPTSDSDSETWRVVLAGPKFQDGVTTKIDYIPAETPPIVPPTTGTGTTGTGTGIPSSGTGSFGTSTGTGTDLGTSTGTGTDTGTGTAAGATPTPSPSPLSALEPPPIQEFPAYMWLAILAGVIGFTIVRSIVIEKTTGIRPNGVLATIHRLNAQSGAAAPAASEPAGTLGVALAGVKTAGGRLGNIFGKLSFRKKG